MWLALDEVDKTYGELIVNVTLGRMGELVEDSNKGRLLFMMLLLLAMICVW